jgi:hypothetical protein
LQEVTKVVRRHRQTFPLLHSPPPQCIQVRPIVFGPLSGEIVHQTAKRFPVRKGL